MEVISLLKQMDAAGEAAKQLASTASLVDNDEEIECQRVGRSIRKELQQGTVQAVKELEAHRAMTEYYDWCLRRRIATSLASSDVEKEKRWLQVVLRDLRQSSWTTQKNASVVRAPITFSMPLTIRLKKSIVHIQSPADFHSVCHGPFNVSSSAEILSSPDKLRWRVMSSLVDTSIHLDEHAMKDRYTYLCGPKPEAAGELLSPRIPSLESFFHVYMQRRSMLKARVLLLSSPVTFQNIHFYGPIFAIKPAIDRLSITLDALAITFINCSFEPIKRPVPASHWSKLISKWQNKLRRASPTQKVVCERMLLIYHSIRELCYGSMGRFLQTRDAQVHVFSGCVVLFQDCYFGKGKAPCIVAEKGSNVVIRGCVFRGTGSALSRANVKDLPPHAAIVSRGSSLLLVRESLFLLCNCGLASFGDLYAQTDNDALLVDSLESRLAAEMKFDTLNPFHKEFMATYYNDRKAFRSLLQDAGIISRDTLAEICMKLVSQCLFCSCGISIASYGEFTRGVTITDCSIVQQSLCPRADADIEADDNDIVIGPIPVAGIQAVGSSIDVARVYFGVPVYACIALAECQFTISNCYTTGSVTPKDPGNDVDALLHTGASDMLEKMFGGAELVFVTKSSYLPATLFQQFRDQRVWQDKRERKRLKYIGKTFQHMDKPYLHVGYTDITLTDKHMLSKRKVYSEPCNYEPSGDSVAIHLCHSAGTISDCFFADHLFWHGVHMVRSAVTMQRTGLFHGAVGVYAENSRLVVRNTLVRHQRHSGCISYDSTLFVEDGTELSRTGRVGIGGRHSDIYLHRVTVNDVAVGLRLECDCALTMIDSTISLANTGITLSSNSVCSQKEVCFLDVQKEVNKV
ncbi:hypothetical protein GMRT_12041 [Giardia muris]|uniref:Uncharacterized protein n=1 Tax=Giardia muris TaxID=5742 RepID=A0A4Z1T3U6_GIAMU|nr:hypothetical protein GMRT_12041 [Giardia muris]|eukprot:TNJ27717.1 hypothetical protein GMRT_12041 [Giardia muris]